LLIRLGKGIAGSLACEVALGADRKLVEADELRRPVYTPHEIIDLFRVQNLAADESKNDRFVLRHETQRCKIVSPSGYRIRGESVGHSFSETDTPRRSDTRPRQVAEMIGTEWRAARCLC
jgi:hypothetical protein